MGALHGSIFGTSLTSGGTVFGETRDRGKLNSIRNAPEAESLDPVGEHLVPDRAQRPADAGLVLPDLAELPRRG